MGYKQHNSPFNKLTSGFTNPKRARNNFKPLEFDTKGLDDIVNNTADGETVLKDDKPKDDKKEKEGDGINADIVKEINLTEKGKKDLATAKNIKSRRKSRNKLSKDANKTLRKLERGERKNDLNKDEQGLLNEYRNKKEYLDKSDLGGKNVAETEESFSEYYDAGIENAKKEAAEAKKEEERKAQENYEKNIKNDPYYNMQNIGPNLGNKSGGSGMYKQNDMDNKEIKYGTQHLRSKGSAFPMVAQTPQVDAYGNPMQPNRAGRGAESNQLSNNPNIMQPDNKVANSAYNANQQFSNIASDAGQPHQMPYQAMSTAGNTPAYGQPSKELQGKQHNLPEHLKAKIEDAPGMYDSDGPASFKSLVSKLESEGKSKESATKIAGSVANAKMKGAGSGPTAAQKARSKGPGMRGDHAHTKITKGNVKSAEKDDAAHIDYLKRDINYDAKHGGSDKQMTNDEKHISKLAGDLKYDNHTKRKYDNTNSALSMKMQSPYKQIKYSHSFSDSPLNMGPFEEDEIPINTKTVAKDQSSIKSVKKKKNGVIVKGTGSMGEKIKMKSKHGKNKTKLKAKF